MKILSVNAGSSSLKFQLYEMPEEKVLISGLMERIGVGNSFYTIKVNGEKIKKEVELNNHEEAFETLVKELEENNVVESLDEIEGIGHRVVQGGDYFDKTVVIDDEVLAKRIYTKIETASKSSYNYKKSNLKQKVNYSKKQINHARSKEVVVKITGNSKNLQQWQKHFNYNTRAGNLIAFEDEFTTYKGKDELDKLNKINLQSASIILDS